MSYNRTGKSGLKLPTLSLGLWHNFGSNGDYENMKAMCFTAFDMGITHFDLANNYGPEPGSAERNLGRILKEEMYAYRDELILSTKAGYDMWEGPYGNYGSRKYLLASLDQSLKRMGVEYVDIFVSNCNVTFELVVRVFYGFTFFGNVLKHSYVRVTFAGSRGDK